LKELCLNHSIDVALSNTDVLAIKAAFEANQGLEQLVFKSVTVEKPQDLALILQGLASAPKLRTLSLHVSCAAVLPRAFCEMFADALKLCKNESLERFVCWRKLHSTTKDLWNQEVNPILLFNRERRCFKANVRSCTDGKQLIRALMFAEATDNHHFRYCVVRNYAGDLQRRESGQPQSRPGKRKRHV
jgi:hypothetical protein